MLLNYKIKFLSIYENWFYKGEKLYFINAFKIYAYKDSFKNLNTLLYKKEKRYTLINNLLIKEVDIFKQFKSNTRNEIRKAEKLNLVIKLNKISNQEFIEFYNNFAKSKNLSLLSKSRLSKYSNNLFYISASLNDNITNVNVYLTDKNNFITRLLYSVSNIHNTEEKNRRKEIGYINRYLHWEAMKYFKKNNYIIYDWGGYNEKNKHLVGIAKFKISFGGEIVKKYNYYSYLFYILNIIKDKIK